ncbi:MAG: glycosyltransferase family 9 protein, partial [bacterium]|nr:glycosyltransferase family 9 protein [bacterium]
LAIPASEAIKQRYPGSRLTFLTVNENRNVYEDFDCVDQIIYLNVRSLSTFAAAFIRLIIKLRKERFDCVIDLEQFARVSAITSYLTGAAERVGFSIDRHIRRRLYTTRIRYNNDQHVINTFYDTALAVGCRKQEAVLPMKIPSSDEDRKALAGLLYENRVQTSDILIGAHVGSGPNFVLRRWPQNRFARVFDHLVEHYNARIVLTGSPGETDLIRATIDMMNEDNRKNVIIATGLTIRQLALLIERCSLFLCNDTGPLHLASAMKTPSISFFGPNTPYVYGPLGDNNTVFYTNLPCSPCLSNFTEKTTSCKNPVCLEKIDVKEVVIVIDQKYSKMLKASL